ncbi:hypothetical protein L3Y34_008543 [Caenorhabditis briggsae]|uniref:Uncharacterized protein n=1 Tax=Caenorhabditis briggsae TaxID=6238 RepID=A0AAE9A1P7_CAEBR|nr:hypothetical protein L3Y34_008543 [Caenorhabditis briggsae]
MKHPTFFNSNSIISKSLISKSHIASYPQILFFIIELAPLVPPYCRSVRSVDALRSAGNTLEVCRHYGKETFHSWNKQAIGTVNMRTKVEARATHKHSMTSTLSLHSVDVSTRNSNDILSI